MKNFKILSILLISGVLLFPSTIAKADSANNVSEADLLRIMEQYEGKEIILEDGVVLNVDEKHPISNEKSFKIDKSGIIEIIDGQLVTKNTGNTFVVQEADNKVHIVEVLVTDKDVKMSSRGVSEAKSVNRNYYKIFLDPGHGGSDNGAVQNGFLEDEINLKISKKVQKILADKGVEVKMSRTSDTYLSLSERTDMANKENSDIFVSVHQNSATSSSANGIETFYYSPRVDSKELATDLQDNLIAGTKATNRGVKTQNFAVIKAANMSSSLVECGFISNVNEGSKLNSDSYQNTVATSIANGIMEYLKNNVTLEKPAPPVVAPETIINEGIVTTDVLNVRSGAGTNHSLLGTLSRNSKVEIVSTSGDWHKIKFKNGYGFVHADYIKVTPKPSNPSNLPTKEGTVITYDLNVRDSASYSANNLGVIKIDSKVDVIENMGEWSKIKYNNSTGYVLSKYIEYSAPTKEGTVITYDLNVRDSASYSANNLGVIKVGSKVNVIENMGEWSKVKYNNSVGYVLSRYIEYSVPTIPGTVITYDLNVRDSASYSANNLGVIKIGSKVNVIENMGEWSKIKYNNSTGYVLTKYIKF